MTKQELTEELARGMEVSKKEAQVVLEIILDTIVHALNVGDKVEVRGFGSFRTRQRGARVVRNPKTGAEVQVSAKRISFFKPSKELTALLNGSKAEHGSS